MKFEWNDLFMAMLGAIFVVFGANLLSEGIYHSDVPEVAGYEIEGGEVESAAGGAAEAAVVDASFMMGSVDAAEGEKVAKKCVACHNFAEGSANKVGPQLWDVINRPIAGVSDFAYSNALKTYGEGKEWTFTEMNGFLYKPKAHVPGTIMGFAGIKDDEQRAEILAYLRTLSANPAPMPDPASAPAAEGAEAAPADGAEVTPAAAGDTPAADDARPDAGNQPVEGADTTEKVETPTAPEAATSGAVKPEALSPETNPVNTDAAPAADPGTATEGTATGYGATAPAAPSETGQPEEPQQAEQPAVVTPAPATEGAVVAPVAPAPTVTNGDTTTTIVPITPVEPVEPAEPVVPAN